MSGKRTRALNGRSLRAWLLKGGARTAATGVGLKSYIQRVLVRVHLLKSRRNHENLSSPARGRVGRTTTKIQNKTRDQTKQTNEKTINANEYSVCRRDLDFCHGMRQHQHNYYHGLTAKRKPAPASRFPYPDRDHPNAEAACGSVACRESLGRKV